VANTRPFTEAHAIVFVDVAITFETAPHKGTRSAIASKMRASLKSEGFDEVDEATASRGDGLLVGFEKKDEEGDTLECIHIHDTFVHAMFFEYRGWEHIRESAVKKLGSVLNVIRQGRLKAKGIGVACRDAFLNDSVDDYEVTDVFKQNEFLPKISFNLGSFWRQDLSWTDSGTGNWKRCHTMLTINAKLANEDDDAFHVTEITHKQMLKINQAKVDSAWSEKSVRAHLDFLHERNKEVVKSLLNDAMLETIGLKE
jgi:hypothetical protein